MTETGNFKWFDDREQKLVLQDVTKIPFDDIYRIDGELFSWISY